MSKQKINKVLYQKMIKCNSCDKLYSPYLFNVQGLFKCIEKKHEFSIVKIEIVEIENV